MPSQHILHILTFHLYQPPGSLQQLLQNDEAELERILKCYDRIARHAHKYADVAQLHVIFSVPLLQQLNDPSFIRMTRHLADVPAILEKFRSAANIEFIASGYQHAPLPLIPAQDWDAQLSTERSLLEEHLGHQPKGYYPPGGLFDSALVPHLVKAGYQFALLPREALVNKEGHAVDPYRAYQLQDNFFVFPVDPGFSHAQEHHIEPAWFADEVLNGTRLAPLSATPYVLTTCSDGENGEWFRRIDEENGYFGHFFAPYMEFCETGEYPIRPVNIIKYLQQAEPEPARLGKQDKAADEHPVLSELEKVSEQYWQKIKKGVNLDPGIRKLILQAEGSCFVLDQDPQHNRLTALLQRIDQMLNPPRVLTTRTASKSTKKQASAKTNPSTAKQPVPGKKLPASDGQGKPLKTRQKITKKP
jgi:hypothetical protein